MTSSPIAAASLDGSFVMLPQDLCVLYHLAPSPWCPAAVSSGASMISFGAVLGKCSPAQLVWLLVIQVSALAWVAVPSEKSRSALPR